MPLFTHKRTPLATYRNKIQISRFPANLYNLNVLITQAKAEMSEVFAFTGPLASAAADTFTRPLVEEATKWVRGNVARFFEKWNVELLQQPDGLQIVLFIDPMRNIFQSVSEVIARYFGGPKPAQPSVNRVLLPTTYLDSHLARLVSQALNVVRIHPAATGKVEIRSEHAALAVCLELTSGEIVLGKVPQAQATTLRELREEMDRLAAFDRCSLTSLEEEAGCIVYFPAVEPVFIPKITFTSFVEVDSGRFIELIGTPSNRLRVASGIGESSACRVCTIVALTEASENLSKQNADISVRTFGDGYRAIERTSPWQKVMRWTYRKESGVFRATKGTACPKMIEVISRVIWLPDAKPSEHQMNQAFSRSVTKALQGLKADQVQNMDDRIASSLASSLFGIINLAETVTKEEALLTIGTVLLTRDAVEAHVARMMELVSAHTEDDNDDEATVLIQEDFPDEE